MILATVPYKSTRLTLGDSLFDKEERGRRIAFLRINIAGFESRPDFCKESTELRPETVRQWEAGFLNGLSKGGAAKLVRYADQLNIYCSANWLLYGIGHPPTYRYEGFVEPDEQLYDKLTEEAITFHKVSANSKIEKLVAIVEDDSMLPQFHAGDFVGGKVIENLREAVEQPCIIIDDQDNYYIKVLRYSDEPSKYNLSSLSLSSPEKIVERVSVKKAAPIIWSRRP
ncbi:MAG: hypothetical protein COV52_01705 [Gammaproteobacteria bacterium CG11_big_fil_rev_8_21_14_0_20_46_22]|nr:MAG: hypothetical protein COW05_05600 [Gammaproteobacteria bacterium CG12_big_fil_rev_8_21_14_0_65_46_12]PIR11829.1 MAG: hypothetical protein COV52_01705 [Gammaproteobacteria bacterium CG11_big_fil_rev_8_21_14_0_20_46_22]